MTETGTDRTAFQEERTFEVDGVSFTLRIHADPSGLRGQVFHGEEKIAGSIQIYHQDDPDRLVAAACRDAAVRRAAERLA